MNQQTKKPEKQKGNEHKEFNWQNEADSQLNTSEWFGAIIRYLWHLGRKKFDTFYNQKDLKKNAMIGWVFQIIVVIILIYVGHLYS